MLPNDLKVLSVVYTKTYVLMRVAGHPNAHQDGYVYQHRFVMERHLNRFLSVKEVVHHKNEDKKSNRLRNLELHTTSSHSALHKPKKRVVVRCSSCGKKFSRVPSQLPGARATKKVFCSQPCKKVPTAMHGSEGMYHRGCKCDHCLKAHREYVAYYRRKKKRAGLV